MTTTISSLIEKTGDTADICRAYSNRESGNNKCSCCELTTTVSKVCAKM